MAIFWQNCIFVLILVLLTNSLSAEKCDAKYQKFKGHTACLSKSDKARSVEMTNAVKQTIIDTHNKHRAAASPSAANMMKMSWDNELEMLARKWAEACDVRGGFRHDHMRFIPGGMDVGQNMAGGHLNFEKAIDSWWEEGDMYYYGEDYHTFTNNIQWSIVVGHYTQMAWAVTYKIGCAATQCGDEKVIVCNYGTAGNIMPFSTPYKTGKTCSMCKNCTRDGLCDCGNMNCKGGTVDPSTCTCDCKIDGEVQSFMPEPHCKLTCEGTRDIWYCGKTGFTDCSQSWIVTKCPHMCGTCA